MTILNGLIAQTRLQDYLSYASEDPQNSIWKELLLYTDYKVLKKIWPGHQEDDYINISTSIIQADEYFKASKSCSIKTRPLLLYYCFLNLTRAIAFVKTDKEPNSSYHGLAKPVISSDILKVTAQGKDGLFKDLSKIFNYSYVNDSIFTFEQFIKNIPELQYELKMYFGIESDSIALTVKSYISKGFEIKIPKNIFESNNCFNKFLDDFTKDEQNENIILTYLSKDNSNEGERVNEGVKLMKKYFHYSVLDYQYYFNMNQNPIPIECAYFGSMFILSSIVRYFPKHISSFSLDIGDASASWFINHYCDIAARVYPNLMLNIIADKHIKYLNF
jgi:hypothetical protein